MAGDSSAACSWRRCNAASDPSRNGMNSAGQWTDAAFASRRGADAFPHRMRQAGRSTVPPGPGSEGRDRVFTTPLALIRLYRWLD